jgi:hypothetical protein
MDTLAAAVAIAIPAALILLFTVSQLPLNMAGKDRRDQFPEHTKPGTAPGLMWPTDREEC